MKIRPIRHFFDDAGADDEVAEVFAVKPLFGVAGEEDAQFAQNFFFADVFAVQFAKRVPLNAAPRYMLYFPTALPTKAISASTWRAQPFGQPVMRIVISSSRKPFSSIISSILSSSFGK
ncbi:hypothetical protein LR69_00713 [Geobacillus sp. BCO2]|nr:hypothetical protein LR69_00713 [Geobacillus sp. BCO2]